MQAEVGALFEEFKCELDAALFLIDSEIAGTTEVGVFFVLYNHAGRP